MPVRRDWTPPRRSCEEVLWRWGDEDQHFTDTIQSGTDDKIDILMERGRRTSFPISTKRSLNGSGCPNEARSAAVSPPQVSQVRIYRQRPRPVEHYCLPGALVSGSPMTKLICRQGQVYNHSWSRRLYMAENSTDLVLGLLDKPCEVVLRLAGTPQRVP